MITMYNAYRYIFFVLAGKNKCGKKLRRIWIHIDIFQLDKTETSKKNYELHCL